MEKENVIKIDKFQIKNMINNIEGSENNELEYEVLISTIKFIYQHSEKEFEDPIASIMPNSDLADLFSHNRSRFAAAFVDIINYWNLVLYEDEIPNKNEFETFPKVNDLLVFIEQKIRENS